MRLGLTANYSQSLEKSYPRKGATALRRESCPLFAADKLADADYRFGHAKIEAVAPLAQTGFLAARSVGVAVQTIERIRGGAAAVDAKA
jgi:hypothetical protein